MQNVVNVLTNNHLVTNKDKYNVVAFENKYGKQFNNDNIGSELVEKYTCVKFFFNTGG